MAAVWKGDECSVGEDGVGIGYDFLVEHELGNDKVDSGTGNQGKMKVKMHENEKINEKGIDDDDDDDYDDDAVCPSISLLHTARR